MKEDFLHFIWRTQQFTFNGLRSTEGKKIEILDFGTLNLHGGPDFKNARVRIDDVLWAGHVEMHICSSDWKKHGHSEDPAYGNVILHVVLEDDEPVINDGIRLPCLELRGLINPGLLHRYHKLDQVKPWVPCAGLIDDIPDITRQMCLDSMAAARLESKSKSIHQVLENSNGDWEQTVYEVIARGFGFHVNSNAFSRLASILPIRIVRRSASSHDEIEALLFGCAGMLNRIFTDDYAVVLQREFNHLVAKYGLIVMEEREWIKGRLRPSNLPAIRLSQFGRLLRHNPSLSALLTFDRLSDLITAFDVTATTYWDDHTAFDQPGVTRKKKIGKSSITSLLINSLLPLMFVYGKQHGQEDFCERALAFLEQLPPEDNSILKKWSGLGMPNLNALQSQGLIQLKGSYCDRRRCTECAIGTAILLSEH